MTKTELEFKVNDVFDFFAHSPAAIKILLVADLVAWALAFHIMFGKLFEVLTMCAVLFAVGWCFGEGEPQ